MRLVKSLHHGNRDPGYHGLPLIAFGTGMMGRNHVHISGHTTGLTDVVRNHLLVRDARTLLVVAHTDEYFTSQRCNLCQNQLRSVRRNGVTLYPVKHCGHCNISWNRNANASNNMFNILFNQLTIGARPGYLCRPPPQP
ncbi:hypothetical protein DM01DRAFT_1333234 [Hesseltinella vesiculosa]|uniref:Cas12f1-like TNB domain-containing protein n=1 Tax=Hesseltinella vesiculosa TaxID=101127 RepID=A0A1X2GRT4_9FUNG|nr:hypothetical protein DM01DRAFT_1333234 [Hesseltinella vesiculosa]